MLGIVFAIPTVFGLAIWRSYRSEGARVARGEAVSHPGAVRWQRDESGPEAP